MGHPQISEHCLEVLSNTTFEENILELEGDQRFSTLFSEIGPHLAILSAEITPGGTQGSICGDRDPSQVFSVQGKSLTSA